MNQALGRILVTAALLLPLWMLLGGCGHEVVPTSGPHQAVSGDQVKIYQKPPAKYELLGRVDVPMTPQLSWDASGNANAAFDMLKSKAGAMGATGLLFTLDPKDYDHSSTAGYHGQFYQVPMRENPTAATGYAIYVLKE